MKIKRKTLKLMKASGKARCQICGEKSILHEHHIQGRNIPNANHPSNLAYICPNDHTKIHEGKIIIDGWVFTTEGRILMWRYKDEEKVLDIETKTHIIERKT